MILVKTRLDKSLIHGIGIFSREFIAKGAIVWRFAQGFDLVLTKEQVGRLSEAARDQFLNYAYLSKKTGLYILCSDDSRFFNHELNPNTTCRVPVNPDSSDSLECFANRDIQPGEELTNNYCEFDNDCTGTIM